MDLKNPKSNSCPVCNGSGKVIAGYGVVCTEIVEKVGICPACSEKGS